MQNKEEESGIQNREPGMLKENEELANAEGNHVLRPAITHPRAAAQQPCRIRREEY